MKAISDFLAVIINSAQRPQFKIVGYALHGGLLLK